TKSLHRMLPRNATIPYDHLKSPKKGFTRGFGSSTLLRMHLRYVGAGSVISIYPGAAKTGGAGKPFFGWRQAATLLPLVLFLLGLQLLVTGCHALSARVISDPAPAVARLQAGG